MKKLIVNTFIVASLTCAIAYAQSAPETMSRIRDNTTPGAIADVTQLGPTMSASNYGLDTASGCYYYVAGGWNAWTGTSAGADDVTNATPGPYTYTFNMIYNTATGKWDRQTAGGATSAIGDAMGATPSGVYSVSLDSFYNATTNNYQRWKGEDIDDSMTQAPAAPFTAAYQVFGSLDAAISRRVTGEAYDSSMTASPTNPNINAYQVFHNGAASQYLLGSVLSAETTANTTYAPHQKSFLQCYDATSGQWRWVNVIDAQADGQASTLNGMVTSSFGYGFNGTTWDMLRVGASNELQVTDVVTRAGEDVANDWRKIKKEQTATYSPSYTDTAMSAGAETTILGPIEVLSDVNWCAYIKNIDDADSQAFSDVDVYVSPNNSDWIDMNWNDCDTLAYGALCNYCVSGNAYRYIKVTATSVNANYARAWYTSNKN